MDGVTDLRWISAISAAVGQMSRRKTSLPFLSWAIGSLVTSIRIEPAMA